MKTKHTPGPWKVKRNNMTLEVDFDCEQNNPNILNKNAALIAAAPEMLEALEDVINYLNCGDSDSRNFAKEIHTIIKKAKGE